jgi:hypothetical protein
MSYDDLVDRLYDRRVCSPAQNSCRNDHVLNRAADRIEELRAQRNFAQKQVVMAEAKLAKAVEALENVQTFVRELEPYADHGHVLVPALHDACTTLAELKGEKPTA